MGEEKGTLRVVIHDPGKKHHRKKGTAHYTHGMIIFVQLDEDEKDQPLHNFLFTKVRIDKGA